MRPLAALLSLALALGLTVVADDAWSRAGGGEGYSSGGSGGSSSSSGSGGSWSSSSRSSRSSGTSSRKRSLPPHVRARDRGGEAWVFYVALIVLLLVKPALWIVELREHRANLRRAAERRSRLAAEIGRRIRQRDPAFDLEDFRRRASEGFLRLQDAWSRQSLSEVRSFLSDGIYERFSLQIAEQQERGVRNAMDEVEIRAVAAVALESDDRFDVLHLCFEASSRDREVQLEDGGPVSGTEVSGPFTEYWSFLRQRSAKTPEGEGLLESRCPDCGAPVDPARSVSCGSCGSALRSGDRDWVLCEITQACEWSTVPRQIPGLAELQACDPSLSRQHLEDRASVIFWRLLAASRADSLAELGKLVAEGAPPPASLGYESDAAVGGVWLRGLETSDGWERAVLLVKWSARFGSRAERPSPRQTVLLLGRREGVRDDLGAALTSAHCSGCGAPLDPGRGPACEHCGRVQNDGRAGWVLLEWAALSSPRGAELLRPLRPPVRAEKTGARTLGPDPIDLPVTSALLSWAVAMAACDDETGPRELALLGRLARRAGFAEEAIAELLTRAEAGSLDPEPPLDEAEVRQWLLVLARVAAANGRPRPAECRLLERLARRAGLAEFDARAALWKAWRRA